MKNSLLAAVLLSAGFCGFAQTPMEKTIPLMDSSITRTLTFDVSGGIHVIKCLVKSYLSAGELSFKMQDPEGKTEGSFWLDAITDGEVKPGSGRMTHEVHSPIVGKWKLQILSTHATGKLSYTIHFN